MVDKKEIMRLLEKYFVTSETITISDEGLVSCTGDVYLLHDTIHERLPVAFDRVDGDFRCYINQLKTLAGAPKSVGKMFVCSNNQLTSLEHSPKSVGGDFYCNDNLLTSLKHSPQSVAGSFSCEYNKPLRSLEGLPAIPRNLYISYKAKLPLLRCLLAQEVIFKPEIKDKRIETILNKYAGQGRRVMHLCAKELIAAGLEENAKW